MFINIKILLLQGDSGGPLACEREDGSFVLHGIVNFGKNTCSYGQPPTVYARVGQFREWIASHIGEDEYGGEAGVPFQPAVNITTTTSAPNPWPWPSITPPSTPSPGPGIQGTTIWTYI